MRVKLLTCVLAGALALAACGGDDDDASSTAASGDGGSATTAAPAAESPVATGETSLGEILTTADGLTLYAFTNDTGGMPTCVDTCADAWPALTVDGEALPAGLDADVFGVAERPDDTYQLTAGGQPLYTFTGDAAAGDVNGQGTGGVWFVVTPDGQLNRGDGPVADAGAGGATTAPPTTAADSGGGSDY